jgi:hypothetical protein
MGTKQIGGVYLVDSEWIEPASRRKYFDTLPNNNRSSKVVKVKVLGLLAGRRSYECQVVGIADRVTLSSKRLVNLYQSGSRQNMAQSHQDPYEDDANASEAEEEDSDDEEGSVDDAVDRPVDDITGVTSQDWESVTHFEDQMTARYPNFDIHNSGRLRVNISRTPGDLFLAFFPMELMEPAFAHWRDHAQKHGRAGLANLSKSVFLKFAVLLLRMGVTGLRRRDHYFSNARIPAPMSQGTFEGILYTIRDAGFPPYKEGEQLPDDRQATAEDPLSWVRRFADDLRQHWQEIFAPGSILVVDETMIGWTGATNIHITVLPNKPVPKGVCLKTLVDGHTRVMLNFEFVESKVEQGLKKYCDEGKSAAVILRLTEPWHNQGARIVIADSWFGSLPASWALMKRGLFSILNIKPSSSVRMRYGQMLVASATTSAMTGPTASWSSMSMGGIRHLLEPSIWTGNR